jgi:tetratricopeptide (TPR) repeat protein
MKMRIPIVPVLLVANTGMIVFALTLVMTRGEPKRELTVRLEPTDAPTPTAPATQAATRPAPKTVLASWPEAEKLRQSAKPAAALVQYAELADREADPAIRSLLILREAQCLIDLRRLDEARRQLQAAREGPSETIRAMANLQLARLAAAARLGLEARRHAFEALATDVAHWPRGLEEACDLIIARSTIDQALMLCNSPDAVADKAPDCIDPFADKTPDEVNTLLLASCRENKPGALDLAISVLRITDTGWFEIRCERAPLEDLLGRMATATDGRLRWNETVAPDVRRRPVSLRGEFTGSMRAMEIACGQAGLIARFTGEEVVVYDPVSCATEADRRELVCQEAFSAWRRLLLRSPGPAMAAPGHLLLGKLYEAMGQTASALSEYRYIPQAYPHEGAAAEALLHCGRLRMNLKNYGGARIDLLEMLDRFPDHPEQAGVYLSLAECELQTGKATRASQLYMRLYDLGVSAESRQAACLGAGRCLFSLGRPAEAAVWIERYIASPQGTDSHGRAQARALLAHCRSATGQNAKAVAELQQALACEMSDDDRVDLMLQLSEALSSGEECGRALVVMGNMDKGKLTNEQAHRHAIISARLLQRSGLDHKAAALLRSRMDKTTDAANYARLEVELARCRVASGDLAEARQLLADAVGKLPPGPEARGAVCYLAEVCLLSRCYDQAIAVSQRLLQAEEPAIRAKANQVLAEAHLARKEYQVAAASLAAAGSGGGGADK